MKIKIRYFASIKENLGKSEEEFEVKKDITVREFKDIFKKNYSKYEERDLLFAINGEFAHPEKKINHGDIVAIFPPVSGG